MDKERWKSMNIEVSKLKKVYGKKEALKDINLHLSGNKIIGLLGKNGAGKTTFMRILAGHFRQSKGDIQINEQPVFNNYEQTKDICFIMESNNFYEKFSVQEILTISSKFYPNWDESYANKLLDIFQLNAKQKIKTLSKGMYSALGIIIGLSSNAPITIFDEPYIGLDASNRSTFYDLLLQSYQQNPRLIILSTHLIDEVSKLFEEVIIFHEGSVMLHELSEELEKKHAIIKGRKEEIDQYIKNRHVIHESTILGQKTAVLFDEEKIDDERFEVSKLNLQELFVYLTKERMREIVHSN